jgi:hypothetical protein
LVLHAEIGATLTRDEVLFSWALAETMSPRWREAMVAGAGERLRRKIDAGEITDYTHEERQALIAALHGRRKYFFDEYIDKAAAFTLLSVPIEMVQFIPVLATFSFKPYPVPLGQFIDWESKPGSVHDPRQVALRNLASPPPVIYPGYPIIGYNRHAKYDMLIEGYVRCISALLRWRAGEKIAPLPMIYCVRNN